MKTLTLGLILFLSFYAIAYTQDNSTLVLRGTNSDSVPSANLNSYKFSERDMKIMESIVGGNSGEGTDVGMESNSVGQITLWTGARFSNPYTIGVANGQGTLNPAGSGSTASDGYLEIDFSDRYIFRGKNNNDWALFGKSGTNFEDGKSHFLFPLEQVPEFDARFGFLFSGTSAPTNFNASTVVGSGDVYADTSIGLPIWRGNPDVLHKALKQQVTLEIGGGFTADRQHLDLHPSFFAGLGYQASFPFSGINSTNRAYWVGRVGYALIDQPNLVSGTTNNAVKLNSINEPDYSFKGAPAMGLNIVLPLSSAVSLQTGFNAYFTDNPPSSWNANIGITLDISKFFGALFKN